MLASPPFEVLETGPAARVRHRVPASPSPANDDDYADACSTSESPSDAGSVQASTEERDPLLLGEDTLADLLWDSHLGDMARTGTLESAREAVADLLGFLHGQVLATFPRQAAEEAEDVLRQQSASASSTSSAANEAASTAAAAAPTSATKSSPWYRRAQEVTAGKCKDVLELATLTADTVRRPAGAPVSATPAVYADAWLRRTANLTGPQLRPAREAAQDRAQWLREDLLPALQVLGGQLADDASGQACDESVSIAHWVLQRWAIVLQRDSGESTWSCQLSCFLCGARRAENS